MAFNSSISSSAYGSIPRIPMPTESATQALSGTLKNVPALQNLMAGINPNYGAQQGVISQGLQGVVPSDVVGQWQQQAAERGIGTGTQGSPNSLSAYLARFLGGSYGIQNNAMNQANQMAQMNFGMMSPFMATAPAQQAAGEQRAVYNAAPNPAAAAAAMMAAAKQGYGAGMGGGYSASPMPSFQSPKVDSPLPWNSYPAGQTLYGTGSPDLYGSPEPSGWIDPGGPQYSGSGGSIYMGDASGQNNWLDIPDFSNMMNTSPEQYLMDSLFE